MVRQRKEDNIFFQTELTVENNHWKRLYDELVLGHLPPHEGQCHVMPQGPVENSDFGDHQQHWTSDPYGSKKILRSLSPTGSSILGSTCSEDKT